MSLLPPRRGVSASTVGRKHLLASRYVQIAASYLSFTAHYFPLRTTTTNLVTTRFHHDVEETKLTTRTMSSTLHGRWCVKRKRSMFGEINAHVVDVEGKLLFLLLGRSTQQRPKIMRVKSGMDGLDLSR